jgi:hypothetical protein
LVKLEVLLTKQVLDVLERPGNEVVHGNDVVAFGQEAVAQMAAQEAGSAGDEDAFFFFGHYRNYSREEAATNLRELEGECPLARGGRGSGGLVVVGSHPMQ